MRLIKCLIFLFIGGIIVFATNTGAEEKKPTPTDYSGKQSEEWNLVLTQLQALKGKVDAQENVVKGLMTQKSNLSGEALSEHMKTVKKEHQKWLDLIQQFNKLNLEYETRFPEKGAQAGRKYQRIDAQSVESLDREVSFESQAQQLQNKILNQYPESGKKLKEQREKARLLEEKKRQEKILFKKKTQPKEMSSKSSSQDVTAPVLLKK